MKQIRLTGVKPDYRDYKIRAIKALRDASRPEGQSGGRPPMGLAKAKEIADVVYAGGIISIEVEHDYGLSYVFNIERIPEQTPEGYLPRDLVIDFIMAALVAEAGKGSSSPLRSTSEFKALRELI